jgi:hypothetical protein
MADGMISRWGVRRSALRTKAGLSPRCCLAQRGNRPATRHPHWRERQAARAGYRPAGHLRGSGSRRAEVPLRSWVKVPRRSDRESADLDRAVILNAVRYLSWRQDCAARTGQAGDGADDGAANIAAAVMEIMLLRHTCSFLSGRKHGTARSRQSRCSRRPDRPLSGLNHG